MNPWERFVSDALALGYPIGKDPDGVTLVGFPHGYILQAGPNTCEVVYGTASVVYPIPAAVRTFMAKVTSMAVPS